MHSLHKLRTSRRPGVIVTMAFVAGRGLAKMVGPVTEAEARTVIAKWGELHDLQTGLSAFIPIIAGTGFYMEFAGKRWEAYEGFERHQIEKRRFFDERHDTFEVRVTPGGDATHAWTLCHWDASYRPENSPRSRRIKTLI